VCLKLNRKVPINGIIANNPKIHVSENASREKQPKQNWNQGANYQLKTDIRRSDDSEDYRKQEKCKDRVLNGIRVPRGNHNYVVN